MCESSKYVCVSWERLRGRQEDTVEGRAATLNTVSTRQLRKGLREMRRGFNVAVGWRGGGVPGRGDSDCQRQEAQVCPVQHPVTKRKNREKGRGEKGKGEEEWKGRGGVRSQWSQTVWRAVGCLGGAMWSNLCSLLF